MKANKLGVDHLIETVELQRKKIHYIVTAGI